MKIGINALHCHLPERPQAEPHVFTATEGSQASVVIVEMPSPINGEGYVRKGI